jgi:rhodanese-related sulfurtransferase
MSDPILFQSLSAAEIVEYMQADPNVPILDFRDKEFYDDSHFEHAIFMKLENLDKFIKSQSADQKFQSLLVHCGAGVRSPKASQILAENGFTNIICATEGYKKIKTLMD